MKLNESQIRQMVENAIVNLVNESAQSGKLDVIKNVFRRKYKSLGWPDEKIEARIAKDFPDDSAPKKVEGPSKRSDSKSYDALNGGHFFDFDNVDNDPITINGKQYQGIYEKVSQIVGDLLKESYK